jgi:hypothetical protein
MTMKSGKKQKKRQDLTQRTQGPEHGSDREKRSWRSRRLTASQAGAQPAAAGARTTTDDERGKMRRKKKKGKTA